MWRARAAAHEARVDALVGDHLARRRDGVKHPVHDFLFTYYSFRPAQLRRWSPGYGVALAGSDAGSDRRRRRGGEAAGDRVDPPAADGDRRRGRPTSAASGCTSGRWSTGSTEDQTRHPAHPLRLGPAGTDEVVESHRIGCSHFDAYRFFTAAGPAAEHPLARRPTTGRPSSSPRCLHAGMDLYKHAFRLSPLVASELVADCFELARDIRVLDMRASPYDLSALGYDPVRVETPEGKAEYVAAQRDFAERGAPLRARLIEECERLLAVAGRWG